MSGLSGTPLSSGPSALVLYARLHLPLAAKTTQIIHKCPRGSIIAVRNSYYKLNQMHLLC